MTTASPWQDLPEAVAHLHATEPIYRTLWLALHTAARADETLPTASAIMAAVDLAYDLALASGLGWASPDLVNSLRKLADHIERRRKSEPPRPVLLTMQQVLASARPKAVN